MNSFQDSMNEYRKQIKQGDIIVAYQGLIDYFRELRAYFKNEYPE